ncbi:MAG: gamma-glutamyl-gamma-aminobutyrate hydrolase family protein, partial [Vallitaleaceae bacterium]|jgi:CTP synthase|nr:gamma-glutamyl-gamma-aminobutyrate hydrolase family protein [Vallitaleaceae bacterium]
MRLGAYPCKVEIGSKAYEAYNKDIIYERHGHRYEYNNEYRENLTSSGLLISGVSPDDHLVEMVEVPAHPWFVGVQFHPEFKSRPNRVHPLFRDFVAASIKNMR